MNIQKTINIKGTLFNLSTPLVMGIVNITPDSFYANSRKETNADIVDQVRQMLVEGASIIDIGAQSTRPSAQFLSATEEIERLVPALDSIRKHCPEAILSVDTFYADVAKLCVKEYGVAMINDISGGDIDKKMFETVAQLRVPYVLMHMQGTPQTMLHKTHYADLIQDISYYFSQKTALLHQMGVNDIIIDPGFGFSKDIDQNYQLMKQLSFFQNFNLPLLVGVSRKSMISKLLGNTASEALNGTTVLNTYALLNGANILRVHDVKEAMEVVSILHKIEQAPDL
ncbi:MAG: dihydropteroate synthase [Bacteroidota bacterium]|jgi:dihydropteroate synthase